MKYLLLNTNQYVGYLHSVEAAKNSTLTVSRLIEMLSKYDSDMPIVLDCDGTFGIFNGFIKYIKTCNEKS